MLLMSLDVGSTGMKCAAFTLDGTLIEKAYMEHDRPVDATSFHGEKIIDGLFELIRAVTSHVRGEIAVVGVTSLGEAIAPIGINGAPLDDFPQATDPRGAIGLNALTGEQTEYIRRATGLNPLARLSLGKLIYFTRNHGDLARRTWKYMMIADYAVYRLTGAAVTEPALSSRTLMLSQFTRRFDPEILAIAGILPEQMCDVLPTGSVAGKVKADLAERLGLRPGTPVVISGHDTIPGNLACSNASRHIARIGCGTLEGISMCLPRNPEGNEPFTRFGFMREPFYDDNELVSGVTSMSGSALRWYRDSFLPESQRLSDAYQALDARAKNAVSDMICVPHFSGSCAPEFDAMSSAAFSGVTLSSKPIDFYRAILEGTAFELRTVKDLFSSLGIEMKEARVQGGGSRSALWNRIKADVLAIPVIPMLDADITLSGSAMMAGLAIGALDNLEQAVGLFAPTGDAFHPDPDATACYEAKFRRYKRLRESAVSELRVSPI